MKTLFKLGVWCLVGVGSVVALMTTTEFQSSVKYTLQSTLAPGSQLTLIKPDGEPQVLEVAEGQPIFARKTIDIGAPITLAVVYLAGGLSAFLLKKRRLASDSL